jgi:hypothetical protein
MVAQDLQMPPAERTEHGHRDHPARNGSELGREDYLGLTR